MKLRVVGAYLPRLDAQRLARYVEEDELRYVNVAVPDLRSQGFLADVSDEYVIQRAREIAEETEYALRRAALFEVEVTEHRGEFNPSSIEGAWEPTYLDLQGGSVIAEQPRELVDVPGFRVAFYVHEWPEDGVLQRPDGALPVPHFSAVPERLWQLARYAIVD